MRRNNAEPKPFVWIPLPKRVPRGQPVWHDRFQGHTGKAILTLTVDSDCLFVGSGAYEYSEANLWMTFFRVNETICIPGTSLKGAIRSVVEAISDSCVLQRKRNSEQVARDQEACRDVTSLCPACRIFGAMGFRGRVSFSDAFPQDPVETKIVQIGSLFGPQKSQGRKFYQMGAASFSTDLRPRENFQCLEVVPRGTKFRTTLFFENMTDGELGLVFAALGWDLENDQVKPVFTPKIGGAKPRCFGAVRFSLRQISLLLSWNLQPLGRDATLPFVTRCLEEAKKGGLIKADAWNTLKRELVARRDAPCPRNVY